MISSCLDYLHADVSGGGDLFLHQKEANDGQLVKKSLVSGTVDSDAASECDLCWHPPGLPTGEVSSLEGGFCASKLNWEKEKMKDAFVLVCSPW